MIQPILFLASPVKTPATDDTVAYEDEDEEYDDEDYESGSVDGKPDKSEELDQKVVKIVKTEDLKAAPKETTTAAPTTTTTTTTTPSPTRSNRNNNVNTHGASKIYSQNSPTQKQQAAISNPNPKSRLIQTQNGKTVSHHPGAPTTTTTTTTTEKPEEKKFRTRFLPSKHIINLQQQKSETDTDPLSAESSSSVGGANEDNPDSYVSVAKSVTGSMDNTQTPAEDKQNFESTYYTKSSTCGFFTFSCNTVYGPNGRRKVCKPKAPTNGKC